MSALWKMSKALHALLLLALDACDRGHSTVQIVEPPPLGVEIEGFSCAFAGLFLADLTARSTSLLLGVGVLSAH